MISDQNIRTLLEMPHVQVAGKLRDQLLNEILESRAALQAVKLRMHFIGWPAESFWSPNDDRRTIPDWRKEIALVEHALTGNVLPGFASDRGTEHG